MTVRDTYILTVRYTHVLARDTYRRIYLLNSIHPGGLASIESPRWAHWRAKKERWTSTAKHQHEFVSRKHIKSQILEFFDDNENRYKEIWWNWRFSHLAPKNLSAFHPTEIAKGHLQPRAKAWRYSLRSKRRNVWNGYWYCGNAIFSFFRN